MPKAGYMPTLRLRRLAAELRRLRSGAGLTQEEVVAATGVNAVTLYRLERAQARPQARTLKALLDAYGVGDGEHRAELLELLKESTERGWLQTFQDRVPGQYATYMAFEHEAERVLDYESLFVPGLLQTEDYARAVIKGTVPATGRDEVTDRVEARMRRQELLGSDRRLQLWAVVDEAALRRMVGGRPVMQGQLRKLLEVSEEPNITLQVIPFGAGAHPGMPGSFHLLQYGEIGLDVVYIEGATVDLFLEEESDIAVYKLMFEHLRAVAVGPEETRKLLARILAEVG